MRVDSRYEAIVNNMPKTFNVYIVRAKSRSLIHLLKDIRIAPTGAMVLKKAMMDDFKNDIRPRIRTKLEKKKKKRRNCFSLPCNNKVFKVKH